MQHGLKYEILCNDPTMSLYGLELEGFPPRTAVRALAPYINASSRHMVEYRDHYKTQHTFTFKLGTIMVDLCKCDNLVIMALNTRQTC